MAYNQTLFPVNGAGAKVFDTNYLDEMRDQLLGKIVLEGDTIDWAHLIPGVKNRMSLNGVGPIDGLKDAACGWNPDGKVVLTQKELIVYPKEIKHAICPKDLEKTYLGMYMKSNKEVPFIGVIADEYVKTAKEGVENFIWQGDGTNDGLYQQLDPAVNTDVVDASAAVDGVNPFIDKVKAMIAVCPAAVLKRKDGILAMSYPEFMALVMELNTTSNFIVTFNDGAPMEFIFPGTNILIKATAGLNETEKVNGVSAQHAPTTGNAMILTFKDNVNVGTDMLDNDEVFDIWYSRDNDEVRVNVQFKIGATTRYDDFVVVGYKVAN